MFRSQPPIPQPPRPSDASNESNQLSVHVQRILAAVLPQPVVTVLAAISDALYRTFLDKPNEPPTYTSTLAPPLLLVAVTYLAFLLVYKSIRSFLGLIIFSLKWAVVLGVVGFAVAYHYGNGDVNQGAQTLAHRSGIDSTTWTDTLRKYPAVGQYASLASYMPKQLGLASGILPAMQDAQQWLSSSSQQSSHSHSFDAVDDAFRDPQRSQNVRQYRDLRPSRDQYGFDVPSGQHSYQQQQQQQQQQRQQRRNSKAAQADSGYGSPSADQRMTQDDKGKSRDDDYIGKFSRWMGADFGQKRQADNKAGRKKST